MKLRTIACFALLCVLSAACHHRKPAAPVGTTDSTVPAQPFLPAIAFLQGQVMELDSLAGLLKLHSSHNGRADSSGISAAQAKALVSVFLTRELSEPDYSQSTFPDTTDNSIVVSYAAKADTTSLNSVDVYVDPQSQSIKRLYLLYQENLGDSTIRRQLLWDTERRFTVITTVDKGGYTTDRRTDMVTWN